MKPELEELEKRISKQIDSLKDEIRITNKEILSLTEACSYTQLSKSKLYKLVSTSEITYSKPGNLYFEKKHLDDYMSRNTVYSNLDIKNMVRKNIYKSSNPK